MTNHLNTTELTTHSADFRLFLQAELLRRCKANRAYSLRAFARALQIDCSLLSKLLQGKRKVSPRTVRDLGAKLGLSPEQLNNFNGMKDRNSTASESGAGASVAPDYQQLALDHFEIISDWYHYAILELMRVEDFQPKPSWIARALNISINEVKAAIERLERVGIVEFLPDGSWRDNSNGNTTTLGNDFTAAAFRKLQRQVLEKALLALEEVPMSLRDQTSMTMAIDSGLIPEAKAMITRFRRQLTEKLSNGRKCDAVYQLGVSFYPVTRIPEGKREV